jgi:4-amino-4-deoxy-L-arabinose transferase-like glycosyltransferase
MGYMPLMSDEGIRALVALEMNFDGHYFTPTINGDYYFNKPPLYNWLVLSFFKLFNSQSLYVFRLPNLLMGLLFGAAIYKFGRYYFSKKHALLAALLFLNFWVIYHFHKKQNWLALFTLSYFLIALTFLMKGLQGVAAQAVTLPVFFLWKRDFKRLFFWQHFAGIFVFVGSIAVYMGIYYQINPQVFDQYIATLWDQSQQRTFVEYGWIDNVVHIISYPFKIIYEILPFGVIAFLLLNKSWWKQTKTNDFLAFSAILFAVNNLVYLASPFWHARYIFFLFPLLFYLLVDVYNKRQQLAPKWATFLQSFWLVLACIAGVGVIAFPFTTWAENIPFAFSISASLLMVIALLIYMMIKLPKSRLILFVLVLIVLRFGSDFLYVKAYSQNIKEFKHRDLAIKAAQFSEGTPLHLYKAPYLSEDVSYYIARERQETLNREFNSFNTTDYYAIDSRQLSQLEKEGRKFTVHLTFETRSNDHQMYLITFEKGFKLD